MISVQHSQIKTDLIQKVFTSFPSDITLLMSLIKVHLQISVEKGRLRDFDVIIDR
mgnify:CR=1 FL=1|jgi:hypothetical protein